MTLRINRALRLPLVCAITALGIASGAAAPKYDAAQFEAMGWAMAQRVTRSNDQEAFDAIRAFQAIHEEFVSSLLKVVDVDSQGRLSPNDRRIPAVGLLAHLRVPKAIPILVRRIETGPQTVAEEGLPIGLYPYALALISYEEAAIPEILTHLITQCEEDVTEIAIDLYAHSLVGCIGEHRGGRAQAITVVENKIACTPVVRQRHLKRVLVRLQTSTPAEDLERLLDHLQKTVKRRAVPPQR